MQMHEMLIKMAYLATDYDTRGFYSKADLVDRLLELIATANTELQFLEDEFIEE